MSSTVPDDAGLTEEDMRRIRRAARVDENDMKAILTGKKQPCIVCGELTPISVRDRYRDIRVGVCQKHREEAFGDV